MEVTDEMLSLLREYQMGAYGELDDDCDKRMIAGLIALHEANKPKPEPYGYFKMYYNELIDCYPSDEGAFPLYTAPPTREPLTHSEINAMVEDFNLGGTVLDFVRAIEQAHGIGVTK